MASAQHPTGPTSRRGSFLSLITPTTFKSDATIASNAAASETGGRLVHKGFLVATKADDQNSDPTPIKQAHNTNHHSKSTASIRTAATTSKFSLFEDPDDSKTNEPVPLPPKQLTTSAITSTSHTQKGKDPVPLKTATTSKFSLFESADSLQAASTTVPPLPHKPTVIPVDKKKTAGSGGTPKNATKSTFSLFESGVEGGEGGEPVPLVPKSVSSHDHQQHQHYDKKKSGGVVGKNASTSKFSLFESVDSLEGGGDVPDVPALPLGKSRGTIHEKVDAVVGAGGGGCEEGQGGAAHGEVNSSRPEDKKGILKGKTGNVKRRNTMQVVRRATFHNSSSEKQAVVEKGRSLFQLNVNIGGGLGGSELSLHQQEQLKVSPGGLKTVVSSVGSSRHHLVVTTSVGGGVPPVISGGLEDAIIAGQLEEEDSQDDTKCEEEVVEVGKASQRSKLTEWMERLSLLPKPEKSKYYVAPK